VRLVYAERSVYPLHGARSRPSSNGGIYLTSKRCFLQIQIVRNSRPGRHILKFVHSRSSYITERVRIILVGADKSA
jgi:hypothetical protein